MTESEPASFDFDAFKQAFIAQDIDVWGSFFTEDAEWLEYRHSHPPRSPNRMSGRSEIKEFLARLKDSNVTLDISEESLARIMPRSALCAHSRTGTDESSNT